MFNFSMMSSTAGRVSAKEVVEIAQYSNLTGIEWINSHGSTGKELKKLVDDAGLQSVAYTMYDESFVNREKDYLDHFKAHLEIAVDANVPHMMIPPFGRVNSKGILEDRKEWIEYFAEVYPLAQAAGMTLTLESTGLQDSPIVTADEILEVLQAVPQLKVVFDNGNTATADNPLSAYKRLLPWIIHVHLKDNHISEINRDGFLIRRNHQYMRSALIGTGNLDLKSFLRLLKDTNYNSYITLESSDPNKVIPIKESLKGNVRLINQWEEEGLI